MLIPVLCSLFIGKTKVQVMMMKQKSRFSVPTVTVTGLPGSFSNLCIDGRNGQEIRQYIGGNQRWFPTPNGVQGGCGTVAAANQLAFLAGLQPQRYGRLYPYKTTSQHDFTEHMESVYRWVTPISLDILRSWLPDAVRNTIPCSLGIPGLRFYATRVMRYAMDKGVRLKPVWRNQRQGSPGNTSLRMNLQQAVEYIKHGLASGCPVAMLNTWNPALKAVRYCPDPRSGTCHVSSFQRHWVTVLSLQEDPENNRFTVEVSSWGVRVILDLTEFWGKGYTGLIYFR